MIRSLTVFSAFVVAASTLHAQQTSPNQPPVVGGQKQTQSQPGQNPGTGLAGSPTQTFGGIGPMPWFSNQAIQQQLKLNQEQINRLNRDYKQNWDRYQTELKSLGTTLTPQERQQRMLELQQNFNQGFQQTTDDLFTDPTQRNRFNQLYSQYQGYGAFNDPTLRKNLNLTQDQIREINELERNWQRDMRGMTRDFASDRDAATRRYQEWLRRNRNRLDDILDENQMRTWRETIGDPYEFPADVYFPGEAHQQTERQRSTSGAKRGE